MTLDQLAEQAADRLHMRLIPREVLVPELKHLVEAATEAQRERQANGEYYHELHCNASRREPMGNAGCSCLMYKRARAAEQQLEAQREQLEQAHAACFEWDVLHKEQRRAADEMRRLAVRLEDQLTAIERALPGWASDTSDVPVVDLVRSCVKTFEQQLMQVTEALKELRINANRLCDHNQGGTYEEDCRRSIANADAVLSRAFQAEQVKP